MSVRDEIREALVRLRLPEAAFAEVQETEARELFGMFLRQFTGNVDARWWWEHFTAPTASARFDDGIAFTQLTRIVPDPDEHVWFVAEEICLPFYPVYEATPAAIEQVIGECCAFEYYLIAKDLNWLLCENHHNRLIAVGHVIQERLLRLCGLMDPPRDA